MFFKTAEKGKLIPRGIYNQLVDLFYKAIMDENDKTYLFLLKQVYSKYNIVSIFIDSVCYKENFKSHIKLIESSIKSFFYADFTSAIAVLLPCVEGISRKINATNSQSEDIYMRNGDFRNTAFTKCLFTYTDFFGTSFINCKMTCSSFDTANLSNAKLNGCNLRGATVNMEHY